MFAWIFYPLPDGWQFVFAYQFRPVCISAGWLRFLITFEELVGRDGFVIAIILMILAEENLRQAGV